MSGSTKSATFLPAVILQLPLLAHVCTVHASATLLLLHHATPLVHTRPFPQMHAGAGAWLGGSHLQHQHPYRVVSNARRSMPYRCQLACSSSTSWQLGTTKQQLELLSCLIKSLPLLQKHTHAICSHHAIHSCRMVYCKARHSTKEEWCMISSRSTAPCDMLQTYLQILFCGGLVTCIPGCPSFSNANRNDRRPRHFVSGLRQSHMHPIHDVLDALALHHTHQSASPPSSS